MMAAFVCKGCGKPKSVVSRRVTFDGTYRCVVCIRTLETRKVRLPL